QGCKVMARAQQLSGSDVAYLGRGSVTLELSDKLRPDFDSQNAGLFLNCLPPEISVRAEYLALYESDPLVAKPLQIFQGQHGRPVVIEFYSRDSLGVVLTRDGDDGHGQAPVVGCVHCDDAFDAALKEEIGVVFDQVALVAMACNQREVSLAEQVILDA